MGAALLACSGMALALTPLDTDELEGISGREGIALDLELRLNVTETGARSPSCSDVVGAATNLRCFTALQLANRGGNAIGPTSAFDEWLVLKGFYGSLKINTLLLDGVELPSTNTSSYVASRFPVGYNPARNPTRPAIQFRFAGAYNVFETDMEMYLDIPRASIEYGPTGYQNDNLGSFIGLRVGDKGTAFNAADTARTYEAAAGRPARFDFDGRMTVYGF